MRELYAGLTVFSVLIKASGAVTATYDLSIDEMRAGYAGREGQPEMERAELVWRRCNRDEAQSGGAR